MFDFARRRINILFASQFADALSNLSFNICDLIVAGNMLGVDALAAVAAALPVLVADRFVEKIVSSGTGFLFAKAQGSFDGAKAQRIVGMGFELSLAFGFLLAAVLFFGRDAYFDFMGLSGAVREQAAFYWTWLVPTLALIPFEETLLQLVYADGESVTTTVSRLLGCPLLVGLSILFTKVTGTAAGASMAMFVSNACGAIIAALHLLRRTNAVIPSPNFSLRDALDIARYSLTDASSCFSRSALLSLINKIVISAVSAAYLPLVALFSFVQDLCELLDNVGDGYMPLATMYLGERNIPRVRQLARYSLGVAFGCGVVLFALVFALAPQIVALYGIPSGELARHGVTVLRICSIMLPLFGLLAFLASHYLIIDRIALATTLTLLYGLVFTGLCAGLLYFFWGFDALWIGLPLGTLFSLGALALYLRLMRGRVDYLLLSADGAPVLNRSLRLTSAAAMAARDDVGAYLESHRVATPVVLRMQLIVEECLMALVSLNAKGRRPAEAEISVILPKGGEGTIRLILRDTGVERDLTDSDAPVTDFRDFVIAGLVSACESRRYLATVGCNRAVFPFAVSA